MSHLAKVAVLPALLLAASIAGTGHATASNLVTLDVDNLGHTVTTGINSKGEVVGDTAASGSFVRQSDGSVTYLSLDGYSRLYPIGINKKGDVGGTAACAIGNCTVGFFRSADGTTTPFNATGNQSDGTSVWGINDKGDVVGFYNDGFYSHGFVRMGDGSVKVVNAECGPSTQAYAINAKGTVAGVAGGADGLCGFVLPSKGEESDFTIPSATNFYVTGINNDNWISGYYGTADGHTYGFVRSPDGTLTTVSVDGYVASSAACINNSNTVTGSYGPKYTPGRGYVQTEAGEFTQIKIKIKGAYNISPVCITDKGSVVGNYRVKLGKHDYKQYGFIWTPQKRLEQKQ